MGGAVFLYSTLCTKENLITLAYTLRWSCFVRQPDGKRIGAEDSGGTGGHTCAMQAGESKRGLFTRSGTLWAVISSAG